MSLFGNRPMDDPQQRTRFNALAAGDEALPDYLKRRERELVQQTAALRGMLAPKEKELAEVRQAMQAVGIQRSYADELRPFLDQDQQNPYGILNQNPYTPLPLLSQSMTIKEMILRALNDHFREGATPSELRDYMSTAYGREIDRNSISPQLARLREEGVIMQSNHPSDGKWRLIPGKELRADLLAAAEKLAWTPTDDEAAAKSETTEQADQKPKGSPAGTSDEDFERSGHRARVQHPAARNGG